MIFDAQKGTQIVFACLFWSEFTIKGMQLEFAFPFFK